jgi:hypothetical protein
MIIHMIIIHNIFSKKRQYYEVTFMAMCLIDYMIKGCPINLPEIMMKNMIMTHDKKKTKIFSLQLML